MSDRTNRVNLAVKTIHCVPTDPILSNLAKLLSIQTIKKAIST